MTPLVVALLGAGAVVVAAIVAGLFQLGGAVVQLWSKPSRSEQRMAELIDRNDELEAQAQIDWAALRECETARRAAEDLYYTERTGRRIANRELDLCQERRADEHALSVERIRRLEAQLRELGYGTGD